MHLVLDPNTGLPLYLQIADGIREAVAAGALAEGQELPSVRTLGADLRVNYHTVARAYRLLEDEGLLTRRRGGPYTVVLGAADLLSRVLLAADVDALLRRADALGMDLDAVLALVRERAANTP